VEALDLHVQAFALAEQLSAPVMVCMDGFILTHAVERLEIPTQEQVDGFLPAFAPRQVLDPDEPVSIGAMVGPEAFMEVKYLAHAKQMQALQLIPEIAGEFRGAFGRDSGGLIRTYRSEDVDDPTIIDPTDAIVRIDTSTICGTDLHILKGDVPETTPGTILGHEAVGTIQEVGAGVSTVAPGDRVLMSCVRAG
jgi:hypothetical protein